MIWTAHNQPHRASGTFAVPGFDDFRLSPDVTPEFPASTPGALAVLDEGAWMGALAWFDTNWRTCVEPTYWVWDVVFPFRGRLFVAQAWRWEFPLAPRGWKDLLAEHQRELEVQSEYLRRAA